MRLDRDLAKEISSFLFQLGNQFINVKNAQGAFDCFKYSVDLNPQNDASVYNMACLYNITGNFEGAYRMFKEACRMNPGHVAAKISTAEVARKLHKVDEASQILDEVYAKEPDNYNVISAIAALKYDSGHLAEALEWTKKALGMRPNDLITVLNQALINMIYGNWPEYWSQYEYCLSYQKNEKMKAMKMSDAWAGQECEGKTILVVSDQGSGDAIQFSRYLKEAKERGKFGKLIYLVQPDLVSLLSRVDGVDEVVGFAEKMKIDYDHFSSLLGIMRVMQVAPSNCYRPPHITTDPLLDEVWKHKVGQYWDGRAIKVGIVWAGDPRHGNDFARSVPLTQFLKILFGFRDFAPVPNLQMFSFQVGKGASQLSSAPIDRNYDIVELGADFRHFDDTASALRQMDLLITCDTSVAHLGGSMGIPTWILVANPPEWRWMTDLPTTPWYKDVRLYRQSKPRDWDSVFEAVLADLHAMAREEELVYGKPNG